MTLRTAVTALAVVAVAGCGAPEPVELGAGLPLVEQGVLTACVAPTPRLVVADEDAPGGWVGYDVEVLASVADRVGLALELVEVRYDQLVSGEPLNAGRCDVGAGGVVPGPDADALLVASVPYRTVDRLVVAPPDAALAPATAAELAGVVVGVEDGGTASDVVDRLVASELRSLPSRTDLLRAFATGTVDAVLVDPTELTAVREAVPDARPVLALPTQRRTVLVLPRGADAAVRAAVDDGIEAFTDSPDATAAATRWLGG